MATSKAKVQKAKRKTKAQAKKTREKRLLKVTIRETVAERQEILAKRVEMDRDERFKEYVNKIRKPGPRRLALTAKRQRTILAEGDSWFKYPLENGGIISFLQNLLDIEICLAHPGDEVRNMMGVSQRKELIKRLSDTRVHFDILLFSGGGNDLVGDQFCIWLNEYKEGNIAVQIIDQNRLDAVLSLLEAGYRDLIAIRDAVSPDTKLFFHGYDFPDPNGVKACFVGPWLKPSLEFRCVPKALRYDVVKIMLEKFGQMLQRLSAVHANVFYIPTQNSLQPTEQWWANEIHPSPEGFRRLAEVFKNELDRHM